jgi:DNA-binding transcriptional ArsR family regulator
LTTVRRKVIVNRMVNYAGSLDGTFGALADPTRRAMLARLALREASVTELARPFPISLPAVSRHLRVLEDAGLLRRHKQGRVHICRIGAEPLKTAGDWIARYRQFWEERFDSLERYLQQAQTEEETWQAHKKKSRRRSGSRRLSRHRRRKSSRPGRIRKP